MCWVLLTAETRAKDSLAAPCANGKVLPGWDWSREGRTTPRFLLWGFLSNWLFWFWFSPTSCSERLFLRKIPWFHPSASNLLDGAQLPSVSLMTGVIKWCSRLASGLMWFFNYLLSIEGWFQLVGTLWGEQRRRNVLLLNMSSHKGLMWPGRISLGKVWWTWRRCLLGKGLWPWQGGVRTLWVIQSRSNTSFLCILSVFAVFVTIRALLQFWENKGWLDWVLQLWSGLGEPCIMLLLWFIKLVQTFI